MDAQSILLIIAIVTNLFLGSIVFFKKKNKKENFWFFFFVASLVAWCISMFFYRLAPDSQRSVFWVTSLYESAIFIPITLLFFSLGFSKNIWGSKKLIQILIWLPAFLLIFLTALKGGIIVDVKHVLMEENIIIWGKYYPVYTAYITIYFLFVFWVLTKKFFKSTGIKKTQLKFMLFGLLPSAVIANISNLLLPTFNIFYFNWLGQIMTLPMSGFIVYAILKHHLMNVKVITTEIFVVLISIVLLLNALISNTQTEFLLRFSLFIIVSFFSYLLIRSVIKEVQSREKIQKLATDLTSANTELKRLDNAKSEFLSIASHQLRTPLTSIKGYSSMILEGDYGETTDKIKEIINKIFQSSQKLVLMIDDFLNISRIEAGKMKYDFTKFDLRKTINDIVNDFLANNQKAQELNLKFIAETSVFDINADQNKISQVISNIIDNAVKYTEKGFVNISLSRNNRTNTFLIKIQDSGVGISRKVLPRLFQKFSRAAKISRLHTDGSGLGLYVAKRIVQAHQGKIWAESRGEDKGSTFFVELPALQ